MRLSTLVAAVLMSAAACSSQHAPETRPARPFIAADGIASEVAGVEGTYCTSHEIGGFSGTVLELKEGKFRYWFYSDVRGGQEPKYPVAGAYSFGDGKLTLDAARVSQGTWLADVVNGVPVLWRPDALKIWRTQKRIYDYGVLIKVDGKVTNGESIARPSIKALYDAETLKRIKGWKDPFVHGPQ